MKVKAQWSSCILTPQHSLTGPVGQPFASRLGGVVIHDIGVHPLFWNWDLLLAMSCYISDPDMVPDHRPL
jgi:hypothetical protein